MNESTTVIFGNSWAATALVAEFVRQETNVKWICPRKPQLNSLVPTLERGPGGDAWMRFFERHGMDCFDHKEGMFLRESRNKSFQIPSWATAPTLSDRNEVIQELLWGPEKNGLKGEIQLSMPWSISLSEIRETLLFNPLIEVIDGDSILSAKEESDGIFRVRLGSERTINAAHLYYCDQWSNLSQIDGLPKALILDEQHIRWNEINREWQPYGAIQIEFSHSAGLKNAPDNGFFMPLTRDSGEKEIRHGWGYFIPSLSKSVWTVFLTSEEQEDNNSIGKKIRRLKQGLNKTFSGGEWVEEKEFTQTITRETVRLKENWMFEYPPDIDHAIKVSKGTTLLTDQFGASSAIQQVESVFVPNFTETHTLKAEEEVQV